MKTAGIGHWNSRPIPVCPLVEKLLEFTGIWSVFPFKGRLAMNRQPNTYSEKNSLKPRKIALKCVFTSFGFQDFLHSPKGRQSAYRDRQSTRTKNRLEGMGEASWSNGRATAFARRALYGLFSRPPRLKPAIAERHGRVTKPVQSLTRLATCGLLRTADHYNGKYASKERGAAMSQLQTSTNSLLKERG
jgi:hypothetical protein